MSEDLQYVLDLGNKVLENKIKWLLDGLLSLLRYSYIELFVFNVCLMLSGFHHVLSVRSHLEAGGAEQGILRQRLEHL